MHSVRALSRTFSFYIAGMEICYPVYFFHVKYPESMVFKEVWNLTFVHVMFRFTENKTFDSVQKAFWQFWICGISFFCTSVFRKTPNEIRIGRQDSYQGNQEPVDMPDEIQFLQVKDRFHASQVCIIIIIAMTGGKHHQVLIFYQVKFFHIIQVVLAAAWKHIHYYRIQTRGSFWSFISFWLLHNWKVVLLIPFSRFRDITYIHVKLHPQKSAVKPEKLN